MILDVQFLVLMRDTFFVLRCVKILKPACLSSTSCVCVCRWPDQAVASDCGGRARRQGDPVSVAHTRPVLPLILCWPHGHTLDAQPITHTQTHTYTEPTCRYNLKDTHSPKTTLLLLHYPHCHVLSTHLTPTSLKTHTHTQHTLTFTHKQVNEPFTPVCRKPNGYKPVNIKSTHVACSPFLYTAFVTPTFGAFEACIIHYRHPFITSPPPCGLILHPHPSTQTSQLLHVLFHWGVVQVWQDRVVLFMMVPSFSFHNKNVKTNKKKKNDNVVIFQRSNFVKSFREKPYIPSSFLHIIFLQLIIMLLLFRGKQEFDFLV